MDFRVTDYRTIRRTKYKSSFWLYVPVSFNPQTKRYDGLSYKVLRQCKKGAKVIVFGYFSPLNYRDRDGVIAKKAKAAIRVTDLEMADSYIYMNAFDPYKIAESESKLEKRKKLLERKGNPLEQSDIAFGDELDELEDLEEFNNDPEVL